MQQWVSDGVDVGDAWQRMANSAKRPLATQVHVAQTLKEEYLRSLK